MSGAEDHQGGVHTADFDFYWMWSFLLCLDSHLHFILGSSVRKAWTPVAFSVFSTSYFTSEPLSRCPLSAWGGAGVWGEVGAALWSVVEGSGCCWLERGSALAVSVEMLIDLCIHLGVCGKISINC